MKFPIIITVASEKGGVGKTTIATNLAIYLKAMREDLPVTIISFDNHFTVDKMFSINKKHYEQNVRDIFSEGDFRDLLQLGQYGVNFIPSSRELESAGGVSHDILAESLALSGIEGIFIIDTRPVMDYFTKSAITASDLVIIPVKDLPSVNNAIRISDYCESMDEQPPRVSLIPSIVDGMVKFKGNSISMDNLLRSVASERGFDLLESSIAKSPKVESLATNLTFQVYPVINHARKTIVHKQFSSLTVEVLSFSESLIEPKALGNYRRKFFKSDGAFKKRMESVMPFCPICGGDNTTRNLNIKPDMLYFESGRMVKGFMDRSCFKDNILGQTMDIDDKMNSFVQSIFDSMDSDSALGLTIQRNAPVVGESSIRLLLMDSMGNFVKSASLSCPNDSPLLASLPLICEETDSGYTPSVIKLGKNSMPDSVLLDEEYRGFQIIKSKVEAP